MRSATDKQRPAVSDGRQLPDARYLGHVARHQPLVLKRSNHGSPQPSQRTRRDGSRHALTAGACAVLRMCLQTARHFGAISIAGEIMTAMNAAAKADTSEDSI